MRLFTIALVFWGKCILNVSIAMAQNPSLLVCDANSITQTVNRYRAMHGAPPVVYSPNVESIATNWALNLATFDKFEHSTNTYGENLAMFWSSPSVYDCTPYVNRAIDSWYKEIANYNFETGGFAMNTGHFTQLVWKDTSQIGVGCAKSARAIYVVMNFYKPGNIAGGYQVNVLPLQNAITQPTSTPPPPPASTQLPSVPQIPIQSQPPPPPHINTAPKPPPPPAAFVPDAANQGTITFIPIPQRQTLETRPTRPVPPRPSRK